MKKPTCQHCKRDLGIHFIYVSLEGKQFKVHPRCIDFYMAKNILAISRIALIRKNAQVRLAANLRKIK